ncbi:MAG: hypothetical protein JWQ38_2754 [Flavipsychrobacter sp.]|nr:hypothetical protein [Flavipsychrobacter sp.]
MINWRTIVGLILLTFGVRQLYNMIANPATMNTSANPIFVGFGCVVWMGVGVYLMVKGTSKKDNTKF